MKREYHGNSYRNCDPDILDQKYGINIREIGKVRYSNKWATRGRIIGAALFTIYFDRLVGLYGIKLSQRYNFGNPILVTRNERDTYYWGRQCELARPRVEGDRETPTPYLNENRMQDTPNDIHIYAGGLNVKPRNDTAVYPKLVASDICIRKCQICIWWSKIK